MFNPIVLLFPYGVLVAGYAWVLLSFLAPFGVPPAVGWALAGTLPAFHLYAFSLRLRNRSGWHVDPLSWVSYVGLGLLSVAFFATAARELVWGLCWLADLGLEAWGRTDWRLLPVDEAARAALRVQVHVGWAVGVVLLSGFALYEALRRPRLRRVDVPVEGLPDALAGFTLGQISDLHVGPTIKRPFVERVVETLVGAGPDAIVITGDLVDGRVADLREHTAPLSGLTAPEGVYFVTGNHEYYAGAEAWVEECRRLGMHVLLNEHRVVEREDARVVIAGVTDASAGRILPHHASSPAAALAGAPADAVRVLLAHQPRTVHELSGERVDLQVSGHTHGGQLWPWNFLVPLQQPTVAGLTRLLDTWVYTSRGTGYWGPPLRLFAPSELTLLRLVPA